MRDCIRVQKVDCQLKFRFRMRDIFVFKKIQILMQFQRNPQRIHICVLLRECRALFYSIYTKVFVPSGTIRVHIRTRIL